MFLCETSLLTGQGNPQLLLYWNVNAEPGRIVPLSDGQVPYSPIACRMLIPLYFLTEEIGRRELYICVFPLLVKGRSDIVVDDMAAAPSTELPGFEELQLMVPHLVIRHQHWPHTRKSSFTVIRLNSKINI